MTDSGYPRIVKRWKGGTPLSDAVAGVVSVDRTPGFERIMFSRAVDFYHQELFLQHGDKLVKLDVPSDSSPYFMRDTLILSLRSDWKIGDHTFPAGSLLYT